MKKFLPIIILILFIGTTSAQTANQVFNSITETFIQNDYQKLSDHFAHNLDIMIGSNDGTYGKQQASILMKDFFEKNKTSSFKINHKGSSNERTQYAVCEMKSGNKLWSVYILLNKQFKIIQLQIEN